MLFVNDWVDCVQRLDLYSHLHNSHTSLLHGREGAESERERKRGKKETELNVEWDYFGGLESDL